MYDNARAAVLLIAVAIVSVGCAPESLDRLGLFRGFSSGGVERSFFVPDRAESDRGVGFFGPVTNDFSRVAYRIGQQHRGYLFSLDLESPTGVRGGSMLQLPRMAVGELETSIDIVPFDTSKWSSARVYDIGECSVMVQWRRGPTIGGQSFNTLLRNTVLGTFTGNMQNINCTQVGSVSLQPVLRTVRDAPSRYHSTDAIAFTGHYHCDSLGLDPPGGVQTSCGNAFIDVTFEVGIGRLDRASYPVAPSCVGPGVVGGHFEFPADPAFDYQGIVYSASVQTSCLPVVGDAATQLLASALPRAIGGAFQSAGIVDPRTFLGDDTPITSCTCDADCAGFGGAEPAFDREVVPRPRCHFGPNDPLVPGGGECWIQLEFDRVLIRPEGVEVVIAETPADPQYELLTANPDAAMLICNPDRDALGSFNLIAPAFPRSSEPAVDVALPWPFVVP